MAPKIEAVEAFIADYEATPIEIVGSVASGGTRQERQLAYATLCAIERGGSAPSGFESPTEGEGAPVPPPALPETTAAETEDDEPKASSSKAKSKS